MPGRFPSLSALLSPVLMLSGLFARWPKLGAPRITALAVGALVAVPLVLSGYLGWSLIPRLSEHYSYKAIIDTYNHSHDPKRPEPLGLFKVRSRSPVFYTKGPLVSGGKLNQTYKRTAGALDSSTASVIVDSLRPAIRCRPWRSRRRPSPVLRLGCASPM